MPGGMYANIRTIGRLRRRPWAIRTVGGARIHLHRTRVRAFFHRLLKAYVYALLRQKGDGLPRACGPRNDEEAGVLTNADVPRAGGVRTRDYDLKTKRGSRGGQDREEKP